MDKGRIQELREDGGYSITSEEWENLLTMADQYSDLLEILKEIVQYTPQQTTNCNGSKCREEWCEACCGEEEAQEALRRIQDRVNSACKLVYKSM